MWNWRGRMTCWSGRWRNWMAENYHAHARMASVVTALAGRIDRLAAGRAVKSINEVLRAYANTLTRWVVDAANGNMTAGAFTQQMTNELGTDSIAVYQEGMREGGIKDPAQEMDETDGEAIDNWLSSQVAYVAEFAADAVAVNKLSGDERTAARGVMLDRVAVWAQALESLGRIGAANSQGNMPGTWQFGDTEHCDTCAGLDGQRHRLKWFISKGYIPRQPGSDTLECHGYNCACQVVSDDGERLL